MAALLLGGATQENCNCGAGGHAQQKRSNSMGIAVARPPTGDGVRRRSGTPVPGW
jgi:hypothetical protein